MTKQIPENFITGSIIERRRAFLDNTVKFFNKQNLCLDEKGDCFYFSEKFDGCAIGRWLEEDLAKKLDENLYCSGLILASIFIEIPEWMKELGQNFLVKVQGLHDNLDNWNENGLNFLGEDNKNNIYLEFCSEKI